MRVMLNVLCPQPEMDRKKENMSNEIRKSH